MSVLNPAAWLVVAAVLVAAPTLAHAQVSADAINEHAAPDPFQNRGSELSLGDAGSRPSGHDGLFRAMTAAYVISASTDLSVSMYQIGRGVAREGAFGAPWQQSPVAFALSKSAMAVAFGYGLQRMHKVRPKTAFVLGIVATTFESYLTYRSARIASNP